jgi:pimeloyl-ACP methyl ester carboxylesterase
MNPQKISLLFSALVPLLAAAQTPEIPGVWEGKINAGIDLRIVFHIAPDSAGALGATLDSPDQGAKGIPCSGVRIEGDSFFLKVPSVGGSYRGRILNDSSMQGVWQQSVQLALNLQKARHYVYSDAGKPQTPAAPFPYRSEDVEYDNPDKSLHYGATLTLPNGRGRFPAALLITGSGQQNRDEQIGLHKPFAVIADYLSRRGYIVLRVDDRGAGKSTGDFQKATSEDFAQDVEVSLDFLKNRPETDKKRIGLIGHSEGGMIAPMVAAHRPDICFIVMLAGPGEKISRLMLEQNRAYLQSLGVLPAAAEAYCRLYAVLVPAVVEAPDSAIARQRAEKVLAQWRDTTRETAVVATTGIHDAVTASQFAAGFASKLYSPWFRFFMQYDPFPNLQALHCKLLAMGGSRDIQVLPGSNLRGIDSALKMSASPEHQIIELKGLNHLFQTCHSCQVQEYTSLEETFAPAALEAMGDWLDKWVK